MPSSSDDRSHGGTGKPLIPIDSPLQSAEDPFLTAQNRVRKWLHESPELKMPVNSTGSQRFLIRRVSTEVMFLSEEEAEMYPDGEGALQLGSRSSRSCFGMFSCLSLKNRR
jgi:hypothetical protein